MDFAKQKTGEERRQVGNGMRSDSKAKAVRFLPAFLIRPRYRSATFPPGEGIMGRTVGDAGPYRGGVGGRVDRMKEKLSIVKFFIGSIQIMKNRV